MAGFNALRSCPVSRGTGDGVDVTGPLAVLVVMAVLVALSVALVSSVRGGRVSLGFERPATSRVESPSRLLAFAKIAAALAGVGLLVYLVWSIGPAKPRGRVGVAATPTGLGPSRTVRGPGPGSWKPTDVRIARLGPDELPLKQGQRVRLWADVEYTLPSGDGSVKLFVHAQPGGATTEVASRPVTSELGTVRVEGPYTIPTGTTQILIAVPLYSADASNARSVASASFRVEPR
jgi:hypothetical protein